MMCCLSFLLWFFYGLYFQVNKYLENYDRALAGFEAAALKDPSLNASEEVEKMVNLLNKLEILLRVMFSFSSLRSQ